MLRGLFDEASARSLSSSLWKSSVIDPTSSSFLSRMDTVLLQDDATKADGNNHDVVTSTLHLDVNTGDDMMRAVERWRYAQFPDVPAQRKQQQNNEGGFTLGQTLIHFLLQDNKENVSLPSTVPISNTVAMKGTQTDAMMVSTPRPMDLERSNCDQSAVVIPPKRTGPFMTAKDKLAVEVHG